MKRNQSKLDISFAKTKTKLNTMNSRLNNAEHISDLENRIMDITRSEQEKEKQVKILKTAYESFG